MPANGNMPTEVGVYWVNLKGESSSRLVQVNEGEVITAVTDIVIEPISKFDGLVIGFTGPFAKPGMSP
jgi:hypothetical protein